MHSLERARIPSLTYIFLTMVYLRLILMLVCVKFVGGYLDAMLVFHEIFSCLIDPIYVEATVIRSTHCLSEPLVWELAQP